MAMPLRQIDLTYRGTKNPPGPKVKVIDITYPTGPKVQPITSGKPGKPKGAYSNKAKWGGTRFRVGKLKDGQRICFLSGNGVFKLEFDNWPFAGSKHDVTGPEILEVQVDKACSFNFTCYLPKWVTYGGGNGKATPGGNGG